MRQYAAPKHLRMRDGSSDAQVTLHRSTRRDFYLAVVERAAARLHASDQAVWLEQLEVEIDNIRAALSYSVADPNGAEPGLRLAVGLRWFCSKRGHGGEVLDALTALLDRPDAQSPTLTRARALNASCTLVHKFSDEAAVASTAQEAIDIARAFGDPAVTADALSQLSWITYGHGDLAGARRDPDRRSPRAGPDSRRYS